MHIFHTTSGFKRPNISRNTRWNCNVSLPFKNLPLKLRDPNSTPKPSLYWVLNISYFNHFTSNILGQQCMGPGMGLEAALTWKTRTFGLTKKLPQVIPGNLQKYVSTNRSLLQCKTLPAHFSDNIMVYCLLNVI